MFKLDLEKAEEPEINFLTPAGSSKKQASSKKTSTSALLTMPKPLTVCDHNELWKILQEIGTPDHLTCLLRNLYEGQEATVRTGHETTDCSKLGKEYVKAVSFHPAYLTYMQSTSWEMLDWIKTSWNQDCQEKYQQPQICRWYHPYGRKRRRTKEPLDESERGEWKSWLKTQHSEN